MPETLVPPHLTGILACPRDHSELSVRGDRLCCTFGHSYPVVSGIPILLLAEKEQTIGIAAASLKAAEEGKGAPLYVDTIGVSDDERQGIERQWANGAKIDPAIRFLVGATSGFGYAKQIGRLQSYPIPNIPLENGHGRLLLDVGSNWGRWSVSAARKGWRVVGIDPSLGALLAAQRAFSGAGLDMSFVCGDARFLPFKAAVFQGAFSYSVLQHFSETDAEAAIGELGRVLDAGGVAKVQMAHQGGLRSRYIQRRPEYSNAGVFRVRYWSLPSLQAIFERRIGTAELVPEAFGGLGLLFEDRAVVSMRARLLVCVSAIIKKFSLLMPFLIHWADSVYVVAIKSR